MIFASTFVTGPPNDVGNATAYNTRSISFTTSSTQRISKTTPLNQSRFVQNFEKEQKPKDNQKSVFQGLKRFPRIKTNARQLYKSDAMKIDNNPFLSKLRNNGIDDNFKRGSCFDQKIAK